MVMIFIIKNIKYIQRPAGHSSVKTTLDTYGHLIKDMNQEAAARLGNSIFERTGHNLVTTNKKGATL